jgi:hypothetical protein
LGDNASRHSMPVNTIEISQVTKTIGAVGAEDAADA